MKRVIITTTGRYEAPSVALLEVAAENGYSNSLVLDGFGSESGDLWYPEQ